MIETLQTKNDRILMIDDNRAIHDDFRKILSNGRQTQSMNGVEAALFGVRSIKSVLPSYETDSAYQGDEGVEKVRQALQENRPYSMAFIDVRMPPGWDGIETTARIWEIDPDLQVVICTAYSDYSLEEILLKLGHSDRLVILKKPFDIVEVIQLANALTEKWRLLQESKTKLASLEQMVKQQTQELEESQMAALKMMEDALQNREKAEGAYEELKREVAERRKVEAQFLQAQKMESIGQLAGGVAHDFNNLLTVINGYSEVLLTSKELSPKTHESVKEIYSAGERAAQLTRQLLTFSRRQPMRLQPLDVNDVLNDIAKMLRRLIGANIVLQLEASPGLAPIHGDAGMVEQLFVNLVVNARDAMPRGGLLIVRTESVSIAEARGRHPDARPGNFVCIKVQDTGCGMSPKVMAHIFEPFFTTKEVGKGTGLGLATVFGIMKQHQGWIEVESQAGQGTLFKVFFPAVPGKEAKAAASQTEFLRRTRGGNETILLVEDEETVRTFASIILQKNGYRVLEASCAAEALKVWAEHAAAIDLLLTDMVMPGEMTGWELSSRLRSDKPALKIIHASGYSAEMTHEIYGFLEKTNFLAKPYGARKIEEVVRSVLDQK